jgi:hypothetical protein
LADLSHSERGEFNSVDLRVRAIAPFGAMHGIARDVISCSKASSGPAAREQVTAPAHCKNFGCRLKESNLLDLDSRSYSLCSPIRFEVVVCEIGADHDRHTKL